MRGAGPHRFTRTTVGTIIALLAILVVAAAVSSGCGTESQAAAGILKLGQADNGKSYDVNVGDTIQVIVPGNPTTGYEWLTEPTDGEGVLVEQQGEAAYEADSTDEQVVGSGGVYTFTYKATGAGQTMLKLTYCRPWESVQPAETLTVTLDIK